MGAPSPRAHRAPADFRTPPSSAVVTMGWWEWREETSIKQPEEESKRRQCQLEPWGAVAKRCWVPANLVPAQRYFTPSQGLVSHDRKQNAVYRDALTLLQKAKVWNMDFSVPMYYRYPRHNTALAMLPPLQKSFGRTGSEAQEDSTGRDAGNEIAVSRKGVANFGAPSTPPFCCCEGEQESCVCLLPYLYRQMNLISPFPAHLWNRSF